MILGKMTDADKVMNPQHGLVESGNLDSNPGSLFVEILVLAEICTV